MKTFILFMLVMSSAFAREKSLPVVTDPSLQTSRDLREETHHSVLAGYEWISTWIPSKKKISYTYFNNSTWAFELEYASGGMSTGIIGIDLGKITEKRTTLLVHRFVGNSFHLDFGPYYFDMTAKAGGKILDSMPDTSVADFGVKGFGMAFGIGNRWQWKNGFTWGIDWFRLNIPFLESEVRNKIVKNITDEGKSDDVKNVIGYFGRVPTFTLLGLSLGYSF